LRSYEARSRVSTKDERTEVEESVRELSGKPVMRVWSFIFQSEKIIKGEELLRESTSSDIPAETTPETQSTQDFSPLSQKASVETICKRERESMS